MNSTCSSVAQSQIAMSTVAPSRFNPFNNSNLIEHESSILPQHEIYQHKSKTNASERHCDISKLHIDSNQIKAIGRDLSNCDTISVASGAFSLKQYDCLNNSGIDFGHLGSKQHCSGKGPLVKPPRFTGNSSNRRGVAKSSWVAGGYWLNNKYQQNKTFITKAVSGNRDLPENISRSSSQSSGFVSYSSQLPVARPDSFLNNSNIPLKKGEFTSNISSIGTNEKFESMRKEGGFHHILSEPPHNLNKAKSGSSFSLNPIGDQLAFFDTSTSTNGGNSRPCSPTFLFSKDDQNEFPNQTRTFSRMSKHFISLNECNEKEPDNSSFNSSLDRLTQEAFSELQPKAESSPKILGINKCDNDCPAKTWMEQKITINISLYSAILFISFAVNVALTIYYMS